MGGDIMMSMRYSWKKALRSVTSGDEEANDES